MPGWCSSWGLAFWLPSRSALSFLPISSCRWPWAAGLLWRVVLSVNQAVYWGVVIVALAAVAAYRLAQAGAVAEVIAPPAPESMLKNLAHWRTWLQVTSAESQVSDMLRRQLAQMLAAMYAAKAPHAAAQFIYYDGLQQGRIPLPAHVYAFLFPDEARQPKDLERGGCSAGRNDRKRGSATGPAATGPSFTGPWKKHSHSWNR